MHHPFESISDKKSLWLLVLLAVLTVLLMAVFRNIPLQPDIIQFEFNANQVINDWNATDKAWAAFSLGLDFLFIIIYSNAIGLACFRAAKVMQYRRLLAALGIWLVWGQWLAALLDVVENLALMNILFGSVTTSLVQIARWCAISKFSLIILGLLYSVIGGAFYVILSWFQKLKH